MKRICLTVLTAFMVFSYNTYASSPASGKTSGSHPGAHAQWGYEGRLGPDHWGNLTEAYELCAKGKNQSPVDISRSARIELDKIEFQYREVPLGVVNNGHSIKVNVESGSYIKIGGVRYNLLQYHFHSPSEHQVNGKAHAMEVHFVHQSSSGRLAVVGVFMDQGQGNKALDAVWKHMPRKANQEVNVDIKVDPADLLPRDRSFYHYNGSLTTPPCSEGVLWFVMTETLKVSEDQVQAFLAVMHHPNARPTQAVNRRKLYSAND